MVYYTCGLITRNDLTGIIHWWCLKHDKLHFNIASFEDKFKWQNNLKITIKLTRELISCFSFSCLLFILLLVIVKNSYKYQKRWTGLTLNFIRWCQIWHYAVIVSSNTVIFSLFQHNCPLGLMKITPTCSGRYEVVMVSNLTSTRHSE